MATASELLESSRRATGLSRRELARRAGSSGPGLADVAHGRKDATVDRLDGLLSQLGYQVACLPTRRVTAAVAGEDVRERLERGDEANALRVVWQLAADLQEVEPALRVALMVAPPAPTGDARFDALLAGVGEYLLALDRLPVPSWVTRPDRVLAQSWDVEPVEALRAKARLATPRELRRHGVFLDPAELVNP